MKGIFIPEITAEMFRNGCLESIEALMAEGEIYDIEYSRWIPVSERLPEEYGEYMITWTTSNSLARKEGFLGTAEYELSGEYDHENNRFKGEWILEDYIKNYSDVKVTAWMPLPKPYSESEDKYGKI